MDHKPMTQLQTFSWHKAAIILGLSLMLTACLSNEELANITLGQATISGVITDDGTGSAIENVTVTAIDPSASLSYDPVTTDASGNYSITINRDTPLYFRLQKTTAYPTLNSAIDTYVSDITDKDIALFTTERAQDVITRAFAFNPSLTGWSWLFVDVVLTNGEDSSGITITASDESGALIDATVTNCDGTNSGDTVTIACSGSDVRDGPMFIAYYDEDIDITVEISGARNAEQSAPVRIGQITYVKFELSTL
jgi:hypothetical protein